ncbi:MAG: sigma-70 family RNA polymerase sigma factor [Enhygromyxa sp.]
MDGTLDIELLRRRDPEMTERFLAALRHCVRVFRVRGASRIDSVARDALAELLEKLERGEEPDDVTQWIWTAASNATKRHRRRGRRAQVQVPFVSTMHTRSGAATISGIVCTRDQLAQADRALARMPEATQQALIETALEGRTTGSVANELGVPAGTLRKDLSRARRLLRHGLSSQEQLDRLRQIAREARRESEGRPPHPSPASGPQPREHSKDSSSASR